MARDASGTGDRARRLDVLKRREHPVAAADAAGRQLLVLRVVHACLSRRIALGLCGWIEAPRRVSARLPSHFHLLAQMKVTKAKGPNTISVLGLATGSAVDRRSALRRHIALNQCQQIALSFATTFP
jgi:hypothetical protein